MRALSARMVGRLTKRSDFVAAASGRRFHTQRMTVQGLLRGNDTQGLRCGFTVTKKVGHATERNRIRRRLREAVRAAAVEHADIDADVVVIGRRDILSAEYGTLVEDLRQALKVVTRPKDRSGPRRNPETPPTDRDRRGHDHA
jgi:ribonuclease P protein component